MPYPATLAPTRTHSIFPPIISGYRINGVWEIVEPIGASVVNLVSNPSLELDSTGYSAQGSATIAHDSTQQRRGVYSLKITPTAATLDGAFYSSITVVGSSVYTLSLDLRGAGGVKYRVYIANTTNNAVSAVKSITATGGWQRISLTYQEPFTPGASVVRRIVITKDFSTSTQPFWIDGVCVTNTPYPVTYFDGDNVGFIVGRNDFVWNGTRHGSTSTMLNYTRAGGKITPLSKYGVTILAMLGLGMQPLNNISTPQALIGGSQYQRTVSLDRVFDLVGAITGETLSRLQANRRALINLIKPDATPTDSPLLLLYTPVDECGDVMGETLEIPCVYESGLEGTVDNHYQERIDLRFHSFLPILGNSSGEHGQVLGYQTAFSGAVSNTTFIRDTLGNWTRMGLSSTNIGATSINAVLPLPNGKYLVGGSFTNADGDANADYLAYYDPDTNRFTSVNATPLSALVRTLSLLPDNNRVLVGGDFLNAGGFAQADYACILNLTTGAFSAVNTTTLNNEVHTSVVLNNGDIIIGGLFTNVGGNANADFLVRINASTAQYSALNATPLNSAVLALVKLFNGDVIFGGVFTAASGVSNILAAGYLNTSTGAYSALNTSSTLSSGVNALGIGLDGSVYIGGGELYRWTGPGAPYQLIGDIDTPTIYKLLTLPNGDILFGGDFFETVNGLELATSAAGWNGSSIYPLDIAAFDASGTHDTFVYSISNDGKIVVALDGDIIVQSYVNVIVNNGPCDAAPIFEILGPGAVFQIKNYSTGEALYFNLTLNSGERAILDLTPGRIKFSSNFRPNLLGTILPGSALASFRLIPGSNSVSVFISRTQNGTIDVNASTAITVKWRDTHWSIDSVVSAP